MTMLGPWRRRAVWLALGLVLSLIHEPFGAWPLTFGVFAIVFFWDDASSDVKTGFGQGWWFGFGYFAGTFQWIVHPFFVQPEVYGWLAPFGILALSGGAGVFWGIAFAAARLLSPRYINWPPAIILSLVLIEALRGIILSGFPWGMLAQAFVETGFGQALSIIGPHGLGLVVLLIAAVPFMVPRALGLALAFATFGMIEIWGQLRLSQPTALRDYTVRILQTNNQQDRKWDPNWRSIYFEENLALNRTPGRFDISIWPENAVTWAMNDIPLRRHDIRMAAGDKPALVGGHHYRGRDYFNTLAFIGQDGLVRHYYDKHHLVPFGEYIPLTPLIEQLGYGEYLRTYWTRGAPPEPVALEGVPTYLPLICYETIFPRYSFASPRPDWIVQVTNDAWFGNFSGPQQHLAQSRMRAIEQGLPIARAANTGISAIIDGRGRVLAHIPMNERGVLDHPLPEAEDATIYSKVGSLPAWGMLLILAGLAYRARHQP